MTDKIKHWLVRGDTHGVFTWMLNGCLDSYKPEETAIIVVGDCGFNFYLNKTDTRTKKEVNIRGYRLYCVHGNHEARPQTIPNMKLIYDEDVQGYVYLEEDFPNIRYFGDWGFYTINEYKCLVIGGAYSVDKNWRLVRAGLTEENNNPKKSGWFADEQLSKEEIITCQAWINYLYYNDKNNFDFVFTHTCPYSWRPTDKFLSFIDQSTVDTSMEEFLEDVKKKIKISKAWLWGHYHDDRIEAPHAEMYFNDMEELNVIANRWEEYDNGKELDWYLVKSPLFRDREKEYKND